MCYVTPMGAVGPSKQWNVERNRFSLNIRKHFKKTKTKKSHGCSYWIRLYKQVEFLISRILIAEEGQQLVRNIIQGLWPPESLPTLELSNSLNNQDMYTLPASPGNELTRAETR